MSRRKSVFDDGSERDDGPQDEPISMLDLVEESGQGRRARRRGVRWLGVVIGVVVATGVVAFVSNADGVNVAPNITVPTIAVPSLDIPSINISDLGVLQLKVGDCFQDPSDDDLLSATPVPCSQPHTAQLYALLPSMTASCDPSVLAQGALPSGAVDKSTLVMDNSGFETACFVKTPSTTGSVMDS